MSFRPLAFHTANAFSLVEMMVATAIGAMVMAIVITLYIFGLRSFGAIGNYAEMDSQSRQALDLMRREMQHASLVVGFQTNGPTKWLSVASTNALPTVTNTFTWDATTNKLTWDKTGQATRTLLTGCDQWDFKAYLRAPDTNGDFFPTADPSLSKLFNISWTCSRTNILRKNTASMATAKVVLRNLPR